MEKEDCFGGGAHVSKAQKSLTVIIYDISDNKQRSRMVKLLESFGVRIQKSAFEAWLDSKTYSKLCARLDHLVKEEDHVKLYRLSGVGETKAWGKTPDFRDEDVIII